MIERIKNIREKLEAMDYETIQSYKTLIIMFIVADVFGLWWYLKLKTLAGGLLIVSIIIFAVFLFYERDAKRSKKEVKKKMDMNLDLGFDDKPEEEDKEKEKDKEKNKEKDKEKKSEGFSFGMPTQESIDEALGKSYW